MTTQGIVTGSPDLWREDGARKEDGDKILV